jgi:Ca-activated chloride channel family protein
MLLRNNRVLILLITLVLLSLTSGAQSAAPAPVPNQTQPAQTQAPASTAPAANQAPVNQPQGQTSVPTGTPVTQPPQATQPGSSQPVQGEPAGQAAPAEAQPAGQPDQGQAPANEDNGTFVFKAEVQEVVLHATVVDDKNRLITNLDKNAFTVFENGRPQVITDFRHQDVPVAMGIVIDNSGSMREKRDKVNKAALNLVRSSNPQDQVFVVNFNDEYYLDQDFTGDINKLREALEKVESRGGTALYDAIVASADHLKKNAKLQKKVIFVVTDGEDNASRESLEQAVRRLQEENGPTVYAIGILGEEKARRARRALETMASRTGGIAFLPKTLDEVDEISSTVAHDIRNQYTIGYKPSTPKSAGGYRSIHVDAKAHGYGRLTVRTRSGYYPGQERTGE